MNYFSVLNFNIQRFSSNFEVFTTSFVDLDPFAIGFTETWLTEVTEPLYRIDSYDSFYNNRSFTAGGGVSLKIKENLNAILVVELTYSSLSKEYFFVQLTVAATKVLVGISYRPPYTNFKQFIIDLAEIKVVITLRYSNHTIILMVVFNLNLLNNNTNSQVLEYYLSMLSAEYNNELMKKSGIILNGISENFPAFACFVITVQKPDNFFKCTRRVTLMMIA